MICERCHGTREISAKAPADSDQGPEIKQPCPDCLGGFAHCCDGITACNDPADRDE